MNDSPPLWLSLPLLLVIAAIGLWVQFFAPCGCLGGCSVKDAPVRCLEQKP